VTIIATMPRRHSISERTLRIAGFHQRDPWDIDDVIDHLLGDDVTYGLRAIRALRHELHHQEGRHVRAARAKGYAWDEIAFFLGVTRQGLARKWRSALEAVAR